ncbi:proline dehydrogenase family protein [Chitinimonas naiadis]
MIELHSLAAAALKRCAADPALARSFRDADSELRAWLRAPASRYIVAGDAPTAVQRMRLLAEKNYEVGFEFVGENVTDLKEVHLIARRYEELIGLLPQGGLGRRTELNFDLSNVGLLISRSLAAETTAGILHRAQQQGLFVTLSMERAWMVDDILGVYFELAQRFGNLGITLQAYLHRTPRDLEAVLARGGKIRLVKGVYAESPEHAISRSPALDDRYVELASRLADAGVPHSLATQDARLIDRLAAEGLLGEGAELEMLHGVQPGLMQAWRNQGVRCRVYGTYGDNWYLHLLHRLAEAPENILQALADLQDPSRVMAGAEY